MILKDDVQNLIDLFKNKGFKLYIVGGAVRDYLMGNVPYDYDFTTDALPEDIINILNGYHLDTYQAKLGSIKVKINSEMYEITTLREEHGVINTRYPKELKFTNDLKLDSLRRDFTINAVYYYDGNIYDYHQGKKDIDNKIIRIIGEAKRRIEEDPIRILRAIRFSLKLNFSIDQELFKQINLNKKLLNKVGIIKYQELFKIFSLNNVDICKYIDIFKECDEKINFEQILSSNVPLEEYLLLIDDETFNNILMPKSLRSKMKIKRNN